MEAPHVAARSGMLRSLAHVALSIAAFGAMSSVILKLKPWPDELALRAKYEYLADHAGEFDTLFLGSSVTLYGIVPPLFDSVMAEHGHPTHSFNLGVGGMTSIEGDYLLREVLARNHESLKYVFVEASNWDGRIFSRASVYAARMANWHSIGHTLIALESNARNPEPPNNEGRWWRWDHAWLHMQLAASHYTCVGQGPRIVLALLGLDTDLVEPSRADLDAMHGYVQLDQLPGEMWKQARANFLAKQEKFAKDVAKVDEENKAAISVDTHLSPDGLKAQIAAIRGCGAEPIYYVGPRTFATPLEYRMAEAGLFPTLLGFNHPGQYPELYLPERHFDMTHFNRQGADAWTRLMAEAFAQHFDLPAKQ
jgi:hypothetical protein